MEGILLNAIYYRRKMASSRYLFFIPRGCLRDDGWADPLYFQVK